MPAVHSPAVLPNPARHGPELPSGETSTTANHADNWRGGASHGCHEWCRNAFPTRSRRESRVPGRQRAQADVAKEIPTRLFSEWETRDRWRTERRVGPRLRLGFVGGVCGPALPYPSRSLTSDCRQSVNFRPGTWHEPAIILAPVCRPAIVKPAFRPPPKSWAAEPGGSFAYRQCFAPARKCG